MPSHISTWASMLRSNYGLSPESYMQFLEKQNGLCPICGVNIRGADGSGKLKACVDHDHETLHVRGLLCGTCNSGLGFFKDNVRRLANAIVYLEDNGKTYSGD